MGGSRVYERRETDLKDVAVRTAKVCQISFKFKLLFVRRYGSGGVSE